MATELQAGLICALVLVYALVSRRLEGGVLSAPMLFAGAGLALGTAGVDIITIDVSSEALGVAAQLALAVVLAADASRIELDVLRHQLALPGRLLGVGLPLTILLGVGLLAPLLGAAPLAEVALLAAILAPTDAALGRPVVSDTRVPARIRQALNVESGLNDGIVVPVVIVLASVVEAEGAVGGPLTFVGVAAQQLGIGALAGICAGYGGGRLLDRAGRRGAVADPFGRIGIVALILATYLITQGLGGSGFVACFLAGLCLRRALGEATEDSFGFAEAVAELLTLLVFFLFGASLLGGSVVAVGATGVLAAVIALTVMRMGPVVVSLAGTGLRWDTRLLIAWFGPRGLASIVFLADEIAAGTIAEEGLIAQTIVVTVGLSILAHGATAAPFVARYVTRLSEDSHGEEHAETQMMAVRGRGEGMGGEMPTSG